MSASFGKAATIAVAGAATFLFSAPAVAGATSIRGLAAQEVRLATIAYRIGAASAASCGGREMLTGLVLHDLTRYDRNLRPAVSQAFSLRSGIGILAVVPGSVAAEAGLRVDDEIIAVGNQGVEESSARSDAPKSYRRMDQFSDTLQRALTNGPTDLLIRRQGTLLNVKLSGRPGCGGRLALTNSSARNAWSDGTHIVVTTGMTQLARSDDEIAFVIAHEMAHNIIGQFTSAKSRQGIFGIGLPSSRVENSESQADAFAVRLMSDGGYNPRAGISFLEHARRLMWWNISLDHPSFGKRIRTVASAMAALPRSAAPTRWADGAADKPAERPKAQMVNAGDQLQNRMAGTMPRTPGFRVALAQSRPMPTALKGWAAGDRSCGR